MSGGSSFPHVREALAARLGSISGLRVHAYVPTAVTLPAAVIEGFELCVQDSLGNGGWRWTVIVTVYVARTSERAAQQQLDLLASPNSAGGIWQAVQTRPVGGDVLDAASVTELRDYGEYEANGLMMLGFQASIECSA